MLTSIKHRDICLFISLFISFLILLPLNFWLNFESWKVFSSQTVLIYSEVIVSILEKAPKMKLKEHDVGCLQHAYLAFVYLRTWNTKKKNRMIWLHVLIIFWQRTNSWVTMVKYEVSSIVITTVLLILVVLVVTGNIVVCLIIKRNRQMR